MKISDETIELMSRDLLVYGTSCLRCRSDGTVERVAPEKICLFEPDGATDAEIRELTEQRDIAQATIEELSQERDELRERVEVLEMQLSLQGLEPAVGGVQ